MAEVVTYSLSRTRFKYERINGLPKLRVWEKSGS